MNTLWKYLQYGYLIIAIVLPIEGILKWSEDRELSYFYFGFSIFITLVFFFKRHFRKKVALKNKQ